MKDLVVDFLPPALCGERTMVLAEKNHRFVLRHANRGCLIEKGQIHHQAPAAELIGSEALHRYLGV